MPPLDDDPWFDDAAGPLVRPYTVSNGRTRPTVEFDLLSLVMSTGRVPELIEREHARTLDLCRTPTSVAEVAAYLRLPVMVTKVVLSDLVDCDAVTMRAPRPAGDPADQALLEKLLDGLQRRL